MTKSKQASPYFERIYQVVRQIPRGRVATYGQVARMVGGCSAQMIGFALAALKDGTDVPWQRVINRFGKISPHGYGFGTMRQYELLFAEGIEFSGTDTIDLDRYGWEIAPGNHPL